MQYALGDDATTAPADNLYTTSIPTATNAGTYYVWYKVVGDENHSDTAPVCLTVKIDRVIVPVIDDEPEEPTPAKHPHTDVDTTKPGSLDHYKATETYSEGTYSDVAPDAWYAENVAAAYEYGLMIGDDKGAFGVGDSLKLGEALAIADRLHNLYYGGDAWFDQTYGDNWYDVYVDYAIEYGIMEKDQYDPEAEATRAQFAAIISAALPDEALAAINDVKALPDVAETHPNFAAIIRLYNAGILNGTDSKGTFMPDTTITREQIAAIVTRVANPELRKTVVLE